MQLYRVTYDQLTLISVFDDKGDKVSDREERVRVSMHDLPLQTAQMYRDKMTGLNFMMEPQQPGRSEEPRTYKRDRRREDASQARAAARPAPPAPTKQEKINQAAASGDMTAAINVKGK